MIRAAWKFILGGIFVYLISLLILLPASHVHALLETRMTMPRQLGMHNISGTIWSGHIASLAWQGHTLGELNWSLSPWQLLRGRLQLQTLLQGSDTTISAQLQLRSDHSLHLQDLRARLPAAQLMTFNQGLPIAIDGVISLHLEKASLRLQDKLSLQGKATWNQARLITGQPLNLGDLSLIFEPKNDGGSQGLLSDNGGPLEIKGNINLDPRGTYQFTAQLRARPGAEDNLAQILQLLDRADSRGFYQLRYSGRL